MKSLQYNKTSIYGFILILLLSGCTATSIVSSWSNPDAPANSAKFDKVMVAVLGGSEVSRRTAEDYLSQLNPKLIPSYNIVTKEMISSDEKLAQGLQSQGLMDYSP